MVPKAPRKRKTRREVPTVVVEEEGKDGEPEPSSCGVSIFGIDYIVDSAETCSSAYK